MNVLKTGYFSWKRIINWPFNVRHFFRTLKWAYQRMTRGYCDADVWSLDSFLANLIGDSVKHLADTTHGYPPECTEESWNEILLKIAECFKNADKWAESDVYDDTCYSEYIRLKKARNADMFSGDDTEEEAGLLEKSREREILNSEFSAINKEIGLKLLAEWWYHLWD